MTDPYKGHAVVELMGHRRLAGMVQEVQQYGVTMLRLDVPGPLVCEYCGRPVEPAMLHADPYAMKCYGTKEKPGCGTVAAKPSIKATQFYGGSSLYCVTPCDEATARAVAAMSQDAAPVKSWELPRLPAAREPEPDDDETEDEEEKDDAIPW